MIVLRYGLDGHEHTLEEAGNILGVTRERVRQIQARAEGRLQFLLRKEAPPERPSGDGKAAQNDSTDDVPDD